MRSLTSDEIRANAEIIDNLVRSDGWKLLMAVLEAHEENLMKKILLNKYEDGETYDSVRAEVLALRKFYNSPRFFTEEARAVDLQDERDNVSDGADAPDAA